MAACASREAPRAQGLPETTIVAAPSATPPDAAIAQVESAPSPRPTGPTDPLEITFVGDVMFGRFVPNGFRAISGDNFEPLREVRPLLRADISIANLETPVMREPPARSPFGTRLRFVASPNNIRSLMSAGITAVNLANNHSYDMRLAGARQTPTVLAELGLPMIGRSWDAKPYFRVTTIQRKGWRIGFVGITTIRNGPQRHNAPVLPYASRAQLIPKRLAPVIQAARADHDLIFAIVHWGREWQPHPVRAQIQAARALIDAGANAVIAHHPHVLQAVETRGRGLIAYSLGNFLFDNLQPTPRLTGVLRITATPGSDCLHARFHPVYIAGSPTPHPVPATGKWASGVRDRMTRLSNAFGTKWIQDSEDLLLDHTCGPAASNPG